jgi:hypothetical protein
VGDSWRIDPKGASTFEAAIAMDFHEAFGPYRAALCSLTDAIGPACCYSQHSHTWMERGSLSGPLSVATDVTASFFSFLPRPPILPQFYQLGNGHGLGGRFPLPLPQKRNDVSSAFMKHRGLSSPTFCNATREASWFPVPRTGSLQGNMATDSRMVPAWHPQGVIPRYIGIPAPQVGCLLLYDAGTASDHLS